MQWLSERDAIYNTLEDWYFTNKDSLLEYSGKWVGVYKLGAVVIKESRKEAQKHALELMPEGQGAIFVTQVGNEEGCIPVHYLSPSQFISPSEVVKTLRVHQAKLEDMVSDNRKSVVSDVLDELCASTFSPSLTDGMPKATQPARGYCVVQISEEMFMVPLNVLMKAGWDSVFDRIHQGVRNFSFPDRSARNFKDIVWLLESETSSVEMLVKSRDLRARQSIL